jgi:hypothetical protein
MILGMISHARFPFQRDLSNILLGGWLGGILIYSSSGGSISLLDRRQASPGAVVAMTMRAL